MMDDDIPMAEDIVVGDDIPMLDNAQNIIDFDIDFDTNFDFAFEMPTTSTAGTSTPNTSTQNVQDHPYTTQDLTQILETIAPYPKAPPRKKGSRCGRQPRKASILTGEDTFKEIEAQSKARDEKKAAVEARKKLSAEKKAAAQQKKAAIAEK